MRNTLMLLGLHKFLDDNRDKHYQRQWTVFTEDELRTDHKDALFTCGTKACAAGWVTLLNGDRIDPNSAVYDGETIDGKVFYYAGRVVDDNGNSHSIGKRARKLLGIPLAVASPLFHSTNELDDILSALLMLAYGDDDSTVINFLESRNPFIEDHPQTL